jgi:catechol 2,3-dioxygenase-like lactoylglutathione lyase family enzyme
VLDVERVDFVSLPVRDLARARAFYRGTLGLPESTPEGFAYPEFETANVTLNLWRPEAHGIEFAPSSGSVALRVADVAAARDRLEAAGVEFSGETRDTGVCHMAFFRDPDGNSLLLHRRYAPQSREHA